MTNYSVYPNALDGYATLPLRKDNVHEIVAADHNRLRDAIVKIEQELGVQPSGTYATVADRLDSIGDAKAIIDAHIAAITGAHSASAISVVDSEDNFSYSNVESILGELGLLLPDKPDALGENDADIPNSAIPSFVYGYGTKFIYNVSDWSGESDSSAKRTQMRSVNGIRGIHVIEVSETSTNGVGTLSYDQSNQSLTWQDPADLTFGASVVISSLLTGETETIYSHDTSKAIRIARNSDTLPIGNRVEYLEIYALEAVAGKFSVAADGIKDTEYITRTATSSIGTSRNQFAISGKIYPADQGTLVLQRKLRNDSEFYPIAILNLSDNFDDNLRETNQGVYIPTLEDYDTITLFDRFSIRKDYSLMKDADGNNIYEDYPIDYYHYQVAKYIVPISNSDIVGGELESPTDITSGEMDLKVSTYRLVHYKDGVTDFTGNPSVSDIFSVVDSFGSASDGDNTVRFSNVIVDSNSNRPSINTIFLQPQKYLTNGTGGSYADIMYLSGIRYYTGAVTNEFDFGIESNNLFPNTYVDEGVLKFITDAFTFPSGFSYGNWGDEVDLYELFDDGYVNFSESNPPEVDEIGRYIVDQVYNDGRQLYIAPDTFSVHAHINATLLDPFGSGNSRDAYGNGTRDRILANGYSSPSTASKEYFLDEDYRVGEDEDFDLPTTSGYYTYDEDSNISAWDSEISIVGTDSLQCGAIFSSNICGLIYPQDDYTVPIYPDQLNVYSPLLLTSYASETGDKWYTRLFSLGYSISNGQLRIVSGGENKLSFEDIAYYNSNRIAKIEVKIPGSDEKSTDWLDISRLYPNGVLSGSTTGITGDYTVPFTFGRKNNADSGNMVAVKVTYFGDTAGERTESKKIIITMLELLPPDTSEI